MKKKNPYKALYCQNTKSHGGIFFLQFYRFRFQFTEKRITEQQPKCVCWTAYLIWYANSQVRMRIGGIPGSIK